MSDGRLRNVAVALGCALCWYAPVAARLVAQPAATPPPQAQVRAALDAGHYDAAEQMAEALVRASGAAETPAAAAALDLAVEAYWRNGRTTTAARDAAERALHLKTLTRAPDASLATSRRNLARLALLQAQYGEAVEIYSKAADLFARSLSARHPETLQTEDELAVALVERGDYARAAEVLRHRGVGAAAHDSSRLQVALHQEMQGIVLQRQGRYAEARTALQTALSIREELQPTHPETASLLAAMGDQYWFERDMASAYGAYVRSQQIAERTLRAGHPMFATLLGNIANAADALGDVAEARALRERSLQAAEASLGASHPALALRLNDLAITRVAEGHLGEALTLWHRALDLQEAQLGAHHPEIATTLYNLSLTHAAMGDLREARAEHRRATEIWRRALGPQHAHISRAHAALADALRRQGRAAEALDLYQQALALREAALGHDHPDVALTLVGMTDVLRRLGRHTRALALSARAVAILDRAAVGDTADRATVLAAQAEAQGGAGQISAARITLERALAVTGRIFGRDHPRYANLQARLALTLGALGERDLALATALEAEEKWRGHARGTVRYLPERQAVTYAAQQPEALHLALSIVSSHSQPRSDVARAYDAVVRSRGIVLEEFASRARLAAAAHNATDTVAAAAAEARRRFANLVVRSLGADGASEVLEDARRAKEAAERALAGRGGVQVEAENRDTGLTEVLRALPADAGLISFVHYERSSAEAQRAERWYGAFVARTSSTDDVVFVDLGPASAIEPLIRAWRAQGGGGLMRGRSVRSAEQAYQLASARLRRAVWDPVAGKLGRVTRVFVVPDALLAVVNIAALPDQRGTYLAETGPLIHYVSTERDIIGHGTPVPARALLAVGGPAFDTGAPARTIAAARREGCLSLGGKFEDLPGSRREAAEIAHLWSNAANEATLLTGANATETALKQSLANRRVIHLATHGFFLGECAPQRAGTRAVGGLAAAARRAATAVVAENPLLLSGLALAGANRRASASLDEEDGILTAEEIAGLDLQGTEWAVLSACDTGLGEIRAGEGVFGLRRAFQIAGVRTVIMSLWSVDDQATRLWMRALYEGRLQRNLSTAEAVREASLTVLRDRRAKGQSTHPFYWAAFVAAGDWR